MSNEPRHEIVAINVDAGIRNDMKISDLTKAMREQGARKCEIRVVSHQVLASQAWTDQRGDRSE